MTQEKDPRNKQTQLEEHSLPGTNQAGKGPSGEQADQGDTDVPKGPAQVHLEKHSLPGTNQAGKGPEPN